MNPMMIAQLGLGAVSAFGAMQQRKEKERIEEEYNRNAYAGLERTRDQAENLNPQASANAALSHLSDAQSAAVAQAANVGAGQAAASGLGGDVNSAQIAAVKSAAPVMAASAQFGAQKAQVEQNAFNEQLGKTQAMADANSRIASLSQNVNYQYKNKPTALDGVLGAVGGLNAGANAYELLMGRGQAMSTGDRAQTQNEQIQQSVPDQTNPGNSLPVYNPKQKKNVRVGADQGMLDYMQSMNFSGGI